MNPSTAHPPVWLQDAAQNAASTPIAGWALALVGVLVGLSLWAVGGKVCRAMIGTAGLALGGFAGANVGPEIGALHSIPIPPVLSGMVGGGAVGLMLGLAAFRFVVGAAGAAALAGVGALAVAASLAGQPGALGEPLGTIDPVRTHVDSIVGEYQRALNSSAYSANDPRINTSMGSAPAGSILALATSRDWRAVGDSMSKDLEARWASMPMRSRSGIAGGAFSAGVLGLLLGFLAPKRSAALITAILGSGLVLVSGGSLVSIFSADLPASVTSVLHAEPRHWLVAWGALSLLGVGAQWHTLKRPAADKGAPRAVQAQPATA
ncbi:MAG: hypothetical protein JNL50_03060 [Phycisphaerae bacterium]|nr:hypothetical protein [Phycisphaerae bacterium]